MVTEETGLNAFLEQGGLEGTETDLGEYIIQLRQEKPSHIVAPAIHLAKSQVAETFLDHHAEHGFSELQKERSALVNEARSVLRKSFVEADVGITGANFLVADTGSVAVVTNEGNADLTASIPDTHIVVTGIEKVVPTPADCHTMLRVLVRSATGQPTTSYVSFFTGKKRRADVSGPKNFHVVLVDNGRSSMIGTSRQAMLRCIRCGACMNHCPVYTNIGGHAYGSVYPGPMGAVLTPQLAGIEESVELPNASTFCGACEAVCPVRIPLPQMMREWRREGFDAELTPEPIRKGLAIWAWLMARPKWYNRALRLAGLGLRLLGKDGWVSRLPMSGEGWTLYRDMRAPQGGSFQQQWKKRS